MTPSNVLIIAEAGVNHNGDIAIAKQLIDVAAAAKADYVKFQTFKSEKLVSQFAEKAEYQKANTKDANESQLNMLKKLEMSHEMHAELIAHCEKCGIKFLSTAFDLESVDYLHSLDIDLFKIPSGEITNLPYLRKIGTLNKKVILSTGMAELNEIDDALHVLTQAGTQLKNISILHCNTEYPTPMSDVNLNAMLTIGRHFKTAIGYSDHTLGIEVPIAAVALGATIIEKHFTLDRNMSGPDHVASLEPEELKNMVTSIRNIEIALGSDIKSPSKSEEKNIAIARKSIVANIDIQKGEIFSENNLTTKRPGIGISPMQWDKLIGTISPQNFSKDELIEVNINELRKPE